MKYLSYATLSSCAVKGSISTIYVYLHYYPCQDMPMYVLKRQFIDHVIDIIRRPVPWIRRPVPCKMHSEYTQLSHHSYSVLKYDSYMCINSLGPFKKNMSSYQYREPHYEKRRSHDGLIFIMGIAKPRRPYLYCCGIQHPTILISKHSAANIIECFGSYARTYDVA